MSGIPSKAPRGEYHIAFDTQSTPGYLRAVKVTIEADMLPDDSGMPKEQQTLYDVSLCDHPLYELLRNYCIKNLPHGRRKK